MEIIALEQVNITAHQRRLRSWKVKHIATKMQAQGYNESYPVTLGSDGTLIDGGHRIAAARQAGITHIPYLVTDSDPIAHAIRCNEDGTDTERYDVFDLAELCYRLSEAGMGLADIAPRIDKGIDLVSKYKLIKERLHPRAFEIASTKDGGLVDGSDIELVESNSTKVEWRETHLRKIVSVLSAEDHGTYRAQLAVIRAAMARVNEKDKRFGQVHKKVTAKWLGQVVAEHAWKLKLARYMRDHLVERVPMRDRIDLLKSIQSGVYGLKEDEKNLEKLGASVASLNEKVLGVILFQDDAFQRVPALENSSISLVITDPPYNTTEHDWDHVGTDDEYIDFTVRWLEAIRPKLAEDYHLFFFCDPDYAARIEVEALQGWSLQSRIVWWNRSLPSGRQVTERFVRTWQMLFHIGTHALNWPKKWSDARFDVQEYAAPNANTKDGGYHPTPKPQALVEYLVRIGSKPGDLILDLFAGGGTTGAASAEVRQRRCILIEAQNEFCTKIEQRLQIKREGI